MKLTKIFAGLLVALLLLSSVAALADVTIGVPDDTTNEARALRLLADNGIIELNEGAGELATKADVVAEGIEIVEVQADLLVNQLPDLDYAVINSNFVLDALDAGFEINKALLTEVEEKYLPRANIIAVHSDNVDADLTKALVAAARSQQVKDYIESTYAGAVLSVVDEPTDGYDADVDYPGGRQGDPGREGHHPGHPGLHRLHRGEPRRGRGRRLRQLLPASALPGFLRGGDRRRRGERDHGAHRAHGPLRRQAGGPERAGEVIEISLVDRTCQIDGFHV